MAMIFQWGDDGCEFLGYKWNDTDADSFPVNMERILVCTPAEEFYVARWNKFSRRFSDAHTGRVLAPATHHWVRLPPVPSPEVEEGVL